MFAATLHVLLEQGPGKLTTTRVAERAGVSIGSMYQYFPNKRALLYAVLQRQLGAVASAVEAACHQLKGQALETMSDGLVAAYLEARTSNIDVSRAIYLVAADLDTEALLTDVLDRIRSAVRRLLESANAVTFEDLDAVTRTLCAVLSGATRTVLERAEPQSLTTLKVELPRLCRAYLREAARPTQGL